MSLIRLIFYFLVAYFAFRFVKRLISGVPSIGQRRQDPYGSRTSQMVRCEECGTFVSESRALMSGNKAFCSQSCMTVSKAKV